MRERILADLQRRLPADHPDITEAELDLAQSLVELGDLTGARTLVESAVDVSSRTLPPEHPLVLRSRADLAHVLFELGDLAGAREVLESVLAARSRTLPPDHRLVQETALDLSQVLCVLGDLVRARKLQEQALAALSRTLPPADPLLQRARRELARTRRDLGDLAGARKLLEEALEIGSRPPAERADVLWATRKELASICMRLGDADAVCKLSVELQADLEQDMRGVERAPPREAEERAASIAHRAAVLESLRLSPPDISDYQRLTEAAFENLARLGDSGLVSARLIRRAARAPGAEALRAEWTRARDQLALRKADRVDMERLTAARGALEAVERALLARAEQSPVGSVDPPTRAALSRRLQAGQALVMFRRSTRVFGADGAPADGETTDSIFGFVLRADGVLSRIGLEPRAPIEAAVAAWREALVDASQPRAEAENDREFRAGNVVRELVFDPLRPALGGVEHVIVILDDCLHLVPLDALPVDERRLGDDLVIELRSTTHELLVDDEPIEPGALVAFGAIEYDAEDAAETSVHSSPAPLRSPNGAGAFAPLAATAEEVAGIRALFAGTHDASLTPRAITGSDATKEAFIELAPTARFLHVATHGWFAPESIKAWPAAPPSGDKGNVPTLVKGMSPMLLCGLAFAGANGERDAFARAPGLVTAEDIAGLDLFDCELAVLAGSDTNVGERRAGQGVASLQKALHMAGARSAITSLWKVPDAATKELMLDFYRRLWAEEKPKSQALWEAKLALRNAKDEQGRPLYATRDWAAWVLTGNPN